MDFDVDEFLQDPLTARVATAGPTVRPTWFLWEDSVSWILTGPWSQLPDRAADHNGLGAARAAIHPLLRAARRGYSRR
ncbi:hypothetical protein GCM10009610_29380 [Pseudonocardia xinjiangensis]